MKGKKKETFWIFLSELPRDGEAEAHLCANHSVSFPEKKIWFVFWFGSQ